MTDIGFTGTRHGMTDAQKQRLQWLLAGRRRPARLHHGLCVGADAEAHAICRDMDVELEGWPPSIAVLIARGLEGFAKINAPLPYLVRNRRIVDVSGELLAAPHTDLQGSGGTWSTVLYARRGWKPVTIILPNGDTKVYLGDER